MVEYHPISAKDQSRLDQFGEKVLPGIFFGSVLYARAIWNGDILVVDLEELKMMDACEIYSKRLDAKEEIFPRQSGKFIFPVADGRIKFVGGDQELRTSTLIRDHPIHGEHHQDFLGETEGSPPTHLQDSLPDAGGARNDFWSNSGDFIHRHHVEPRVKPALYAGGIWEGDILVADIDELENLDASEKHARRLNAKEITPPKNGEHSYAQSQMEQQNFPAGIRT